jgi:hypothetical protein
MSHLPPAPIRGVALGKYRRDYPRFLVVTDADSLLSSVDNDCRNGWLSRTVRIAEAGTASVFASAHVYDEVYREMPKFPPSSGIPIEVMQRHYETAYLAHLRFVEVPASVMDDEVAARVAHRNDEGRRRSHARSYLQWSSQAISTFADRISLPRTDTWLRRPAFKSPALTRPRWVSVRPRVFRLWAGIRAYAGSPNVSVYQLCW